jgi:predicted nucleic acid-binding protein
LKLLVAEPGSATAAQAWTAADAPVAVRLLYPEARAGLAAARRVGRMSEEQYGGRKAALEQLWAEMDVVEVSPTLAIAAGELCERHRLRGYDAVHLAAALRIGADLMITADADLARAAPSCGVAVLDARS